MTSGTTLRLALVGTRVDGLRIVLTALGSALAAVSLLAAVTVASIGRGDGPYTSDLLNQAGLHPGIVMALVGLCLPVLVLLAQCSRIGAPDRDRRLAAFRLAGASPKQVGGVVATEAGLAALAGSVLGVGGFFLLRVVLDERVAGSYTGYEYDPATATPDPVTSALRLPTDVVPAWWSVLLVALALPLVVTVATTVALRRVAFTPFGVVRRVRTRPPRVLPLVLLVVGVVLFFVAAALARTFGDRIPAVLFVALLLLSFVVMAVGLLGGQGALTQAVGRALVGRTSRPSLLLASRRMIADPFAATRATAVLTVAVLIAAGARHLRRISVAGQSDGGTFFVRAYDLVDLVLVVATVLAAAGLLVAAAEAIVARRRTYAAVVAAGTPRGVVARAVLAELLLPLVPSLLLATIAGTAAAIGLFGRTVSVVGLDDATRTVTIGIAWGPLAATLGLACAITVLTTSAGLLFLRRATDVTELRAAA